MKNLLELSTEAESLAVSLQGETSQKKISDAITAKFNSLELNDADWPIFNSLFKESVQRLTEQAARQSSLKSKLTETEKARLQAEKTAPAKA